MSCLRMLDMDNTFLNSTLFFIFFLFTSVCMMSYRQHLTIRIEMLSCLVVHISILKVVVFKYLQWR